MDGIQISMFDMVPAGKSKTTIWPEIETAEDWFTDRFRKEIHRGSGYEDGKLRIYAAAELMDKDRLADFIQQEYYVGGNSIEDGFCDYNGRGMSFVKWKSDEKKRYPWWKVRDEVLRQIRLCEYLEADEMEAIRQIREDYGGGLPWPIARMEYGGRE